MGEIESQMTEKLQKAFSPTILKVINESRDHEGHAGHDGSGESHFRIEMTAAAFKNQNRVACQRLVHQVLESELSGPIHALSLKLSAPDAD